MTQGLSKTKLLDKAFKPPGRGFEPEPLPPGSRCAVTGEPITEGVKADSLLTSASSAPHEIFPFAASDYVSVEAARCYKHFRGGLVGNLYAIEIEQPPELGNSAAGWKPMVSKRSADDEERPCWQRQIYGVDPYASIAEGERCLAIFTEEYQRRLWLGAELSVVGPAWRPYLYWGSVQRTLTVDFARLRQVLALCEYVYSLGFAKDNLLTSLYGSTKKDLCFALGLARVRQLDAALDEWRGTDELLLAAFVCQRADVSIQDDFSTQIGALEAPEDCTCLIPKPTISPSKSKKEAASSESPMRPKKNPSPETAQMALFT